MNAFKLLIVLAIFCEIFAQVQDPGDAPGDIEDTPVPIGGEITFLKEKINELLVDPTLPAAAKTALTDAATKTTVDELLAGIQTALTDPSLTDAQKDILNNAVALIVTPNPNASDAPDTFVPAGGEVTFLTDKIDELLADPNLSTKAKEALTEAKTKTTVDEVLAGIQQALTDPNLSATQKDFLNRAVASVETPQPADTPKPNPVLTPIPQGEEVTGMTNAINTVLGSGSSSLSPDTITSLTAAVNNPSPTTTLLTSAITDALQDTGLSVDDRMILLNALKSLTDAPVTMTPGLTPTKVPSEAVDVYLQSNIAQVLNDPTLPENARTILQAAQTSDMTTDGYVSALKMALRDQNLTPAQTTELNRILAAAEGAATVAPTPSPDDDDGLPWWLLLIPCVLLFLMLLIGLYVFMKRRTRDSFHDGVAAAIPPSAVDAPLPEPEKEISHIAFTPQAQAGPTPAEPAVQTPYTPTPSAPSDAAAAAALAGPALVAPSPRWSTRGAYNPRVRNPSSASPVQDRLRPLPEDDDLAAGGVLGGVAFPGPPKPSGGRNFVASKYRPSPVRTSGNPTPDHYDHIEI